MLAVLCHTHVEQFGPETEIGHVFHSVKKTLYPAFVNWLCSTASGKY